MMRGHFQIILIILHIHIVFQSESIGYSNSYEVGGDRHAFNFSKLPDIVGTGTSTGCPMFFTQLARVLTHRDVC